MGEVRRRGKPVHKNIKNVQYLIKTQPRDSATNQPTLTTCERNVIHPKLSSTYYYPPPPPPLTANQLNTPNLTSLCIEIVRIARKNTIEKNK